MSEPLLIDGASFTDERGHMDFFNSFDLASIRRMYKTTPSSTSEIRAWQAHKQESKWFCCLKGEIKVQLVKLDDFQEPSKELLVKEYSLKADTPQVLQIPGGYANGFKAETDGAELLIFSDMGLEDSKNDGFRLDKDYWPVWQ